MIIQDDRKDKAAQPWLVVGTDSFLSGWGKAEGGLSYAAWACADEAEARECEVYVRRRSDMQRVRIVYDPKGTYRPNCKHLHIYPHPFRCNLQEV